MGVTDALVGNLEDALTALRAQRKELVAPLDHEILKIQRALSALGRPGLPVEDQPPILQYSISDAKLDQIRAYLRDHGAARQADLVKALRFNSGVISFGVRKLMQMGEIEPGPKKNGSTVWTCTKVPAAVA